MKRNISNFVNDFCSKADPDSRVLLVEGARQVGKTYFVESIIRELDPSRVISINLEKEKDLRFELDGTRNFKEFTQWLGLKKGYKDGDGFTVFIDEAQESRALGGYVLSMKEDWKNTRVILTGSSMNKLFDGSSRVPVGRIEYLTVQPFSFSEFLRFGEKSNATDFIETFTLGHDIGDAIHNELLEHYDRYLSVGGMPEAVKSFYQEEDPSQILRFIIASQQDDIQRKESSMKGHLFVDALRAVANTMGYPFKKTLITRNDYEATTVMAILKQWYIMLEVAQRGTAPAQSAFHPKQYLYDIGISRIFRETALPRIFALRTLNEKLRTPLGGLIENAILLHLLEGRGGFTEIHGWKNKPGKEVDFIYRDMTVTLPIEVKASLTVTNRHAKNLVHYLTEHDLKTGLLVSLDKPRIMKMNGCRIINIPAYLFSQNMIQKVK